MNDDATPSTTTVLDGSQCWALLETADVGRLAVSIAHQPEIFPVNYAVDHGSLVIRTAEGTKLAAVTVNRSVAFEVDAYSREAGEAWSVVVKGIAHEVTGMDELLDAMGLALFPWHSAPAPRFLRIVPDQVTGRRFRVEPGVAGPAPQSPPASVD